jgi:PBP1b-binding outer membrane lipoprotein LpoB
MIKRILTTGTIVIAAILATGCASVQMASEEKDSAAKTFAVNQSKANIYVFRNESIGAAVKMPVALNGKLVGDTAAKTYMKLEVQPGEHSLLSKTENDSILRVNTAAGKNYFVWQEVKMGMFAPRSSLQLVDEATGRAAVNECKLIQDLN